MEAGSLKARLTLYLMIVMEKEMLVLDDHYANPKWKAQDYGQTISNVLDLSVNLILDVFLLCLLYDL